MMKSALLIVIVMSSLCLAQKCDTINQQYSVFATVNETKEWDMRKYFFTGENLKYEIPRDCPYFETIDPMAELGDPIAHGDDSIGRIRGLKPYRSFESGAWLNDFVFLEQNKTDVDVFYSLGDPQQMDVVPGFRAQINARNETRSFVCFDLDFLTNNKIIVDCYQADLDDTGKGYSNGFIIVDFADPSKYDLFANYHPDGYNYNYTEYRKILFHNYSFTNVGEDQESIEGGLQGDKVQLLFRGEPAWATEHADLSKDLLDDDCELEVYRFSNNKLGNDGKPVTVLTKEVIADLIKTDKTKQKFYLMDFQLEPNGDIYVLDAYNGVYVLYFNDQTLTWQLKSRISPPYLTICYGFDFNYLLQKDGGYVKHLVLVFKDSANFYENGLQKFSIKLPSKVSYGNIQVQMSQYYLVLRIDNIMYMYDSEDGTKLYTYTKDIVEQMIINPYEPDIVAVNEVSSHRFLLTNGLLRLKKQDSTNDGIKTYTVNAISQDDASKCQISVNVRVLSKNDTTIYEQSTHPFPATFTIPTPPIGIDLIASGPNLQYSSVINLEHEKLGNSNILLTIKSAWNLQLNGIKLPDAKDVIYSDILVTDNADVFYLLLQIPTKIIYVYRCEHKLSDYEKAECKDFDNFTLNVQIDKNKHSFQWWIFVTQITYMYQDTDFSIQIYTSFGGSVKNVGKISVDSTDSDNKITSVTILQNAVYLVQEAKRNILVYSPFTPFNLIYEINSRVLADFNVRDLFTPKRVFGNKKVKSQLVFIQTLQHLYIGDFANANSIKSYVLLKQIPIIAGSSVEVAIGLDHFFVVQKLDDQDLIEEYNYMHLQRIYKTKDVPLFKYKLQKPLTVDSSSQTGWLFVRATDGTETVVLVYEPGVVSHICLHKVLETKAQQFDGKTFDMAVDGGKQMFSYFNNNTIHRIVSILADAELYLTPELESQQYVNDVLASVQVSNYPENSRLTVSSKVTVLNTQSDPIIKQTLFDTKKKVFKFVKQAAEQTIEMGTDWYSGQILNFWVRCSTCGGSDLKIQQMIVRIADGTDMKYDISDGVQYGSNGQVYQTRNAIIFQDAAGKFKQRTEIKVTTQSCELVTVSQDQTFIISTWGNTKNEVGVYINQCTTAFNCVQFKQGFETIGGIKKIAKIVMADKKNLLVLSTDPENFKSQDSVLLVTKFDYTEQQYTVSNIYTINDQYVGSKLLQIGDFDVINYQVNGNTFNTIILTDINNGLYFAHFAYDAQGAFSKTTFELFKLTSVQSDQFFIHTDTKFYQVKVISQQISGTTLQLNVLITTNNAAQYVIAFDLDVSKPTQGAPLLKSSTTLQYVLTPYGNWQAMDKLAYVNGHVAIPYTDDTKVLIGIYDLPSNRTSTVKTIAFGHAIQADYHKPLPIDFALLLTKESGAKYPNLYTDIQYDVQSDEYLIEKYELRESARLILSNSTSYADEVQILVYVSNYFGESQGKAYLSISGSPPSPDDGGKSSSNWWWITLIVIFGVAAIGAGGWFAYQKFGRKGVDPLLG